MSLNNQVADIETAATIACAKTAQVAVVAAFLPEDIKHMVALIYKLGFSDGIMYGVKWSDQNFTNHAP